MKTQKEENIKLLKAASHPIRLEILELLTKGPSCATLANKAIPISQPNLSQHLKALREAGIIDFHKSGTKRCFYLKKPSFAKALLELAGNEHPEFKMKREDIEREAKKHGNG